MISSLLPLPMGEVPLEGAERACLPSQSLRDSSPKVGAKGDEGNGLPHHLSGLVRNDTFYFGAHWLAMTCACRWPPEYLTSES